MGEQKIKTELEGIKTRLQEAEDNPVNFNTEKFNTQARREIAIKFVNAYFVILALAIVIPVDYNILMYIMTNNTSQFIQIKDMVLLVSSIIGGPLGFIVGFYFKDK